MIRRQTAAVLVTLLLAACSAPDGLDGGSAGGGSAGGGSAGGGSAGGGSAGGGSTGGGSAGGRSDGGTTGLCAGVRCVGTNECDPSDGLCKCNGVVCQSGESCVCPSGTTCAPSSQTCQAASLCAQVTCIGGTTCDPVDGLCRCGGQGGPVCTAAQLCNVGPPPTCQGGPACTGADGGQTLCTGGTSCDPSDGRCRCGGLGGVVCQGGEVCVSSALSMACRAPCDPLSPACSTGTWCFFDGAASPPTAYCAPPSNVRAEGQACVSATSCFQSSPAHALVCVGLAPGQAGICREYCATSSGTTGCSQVPATQLCTQLPQAASGLGYCAP